MAAITRLTAVGLPGASFVPDLDEPHVDPETPFRRDNTRYLPSEFENTPTPAHILLRLSPQLTDYMQGTVHPDFEQRRREAFAKNRVDNPGA